MCRRQIQPAQASYSIISGGPNGHKAPGAEEGHAYRGQRLTLLTLSRIALRASPQHQPPLSRYAPSPSLPQSAHTYLLARGAAGVTPLCSGPSHAGVPAVGAVERLNN
jgi:hypothetical protein